MGAFSPQVGKKYPSSASYALTKPIDFASIKTHF